MKGRFNGLVANISSSIISHNNFPRQMPEFEAIRDGVTGSFYKTDDVEALAQEILRWTGKSPAQRAVIREEARREVISSWSIAYQMDVLRQTFPQYFREVFR